MPNTKRFLKCQTRETRLRKALSVPNPNQLQGPEQKTGAGSWQHPFYPFHTHTHSQFTCHLCRVAIVVPNMCNHYVISSLYIVIYIVCTYINIRFVYCGVCARHCATGSCVVLSGTINYGYIHKIRLWQSAALY